MCFLAELETRHLDHHVEETGYWRKANAIHRWFIEDLQHCNYYCRLYEINPAQLQQFRYR